MISFVWAEDKNHAIGYHNQLPWHLPAELKHFKLLTMGSAMVMGKNTFLSLPKVLPGRKHLVLTHDQALIEEYYGDLRVRFFTSSDELIAFLTDHQNEKFSVIGGTSVFNLLMDQVDILEKTEIDHQFEADTFMPAINYKKFTLVSRKRRQADADNPYSFTHLKYQRKNS